MFKTDTNTPASEIEARIQRLQQRLQQLSIDGALILQLTDLFYFSGTIQQAHLYVPASGQPLLLVRKSFERAQAESALSRILPLGSPKKIPAILAENGLPRPRRLGLELDVLPTNLYFTYRDIFEDAEIVDISTPIRMIRAIKSPYELDLVRTSCRLADQVAGHVKTLIKPGIAEIALAGQIEAYARSLGHQGVVRMRLWGSELFYGHLMCGASATVPSYLSSPTGGAATSPAVAQGPGFSLIQPQEAVLFDYVFATQGYLADQTRIFALNGLPDDLLRAHESLLALQEAIKKEARPGVKAGDLYMSAVRMAEESGLAETFMGNGPQRIRFVGHGIGLELDEFPFLAQGQEMPLEEGMVIALEPKAIFPGRGVVGIENTHIVTASGLEQLTVFPDGVTIV